ncbi:hypothetical protein SAMN05443377_10463 [Propionibacterium cyclohexanicum]|uniref:Uncharacterized protein n=1 Tax=Propionibacterium cyclohexanicum TaxID=64702 RepID=A0A1H9QQS8_9ACTN|nr:hypothetical protein SAMN05443377_10463 [Propionibacterium cyclohexanicum]
MPPHPSPRSAGTHAPVSPVPVSAAPVRPGIGQGRFAEQERISGLADLRIIRRP